MCLVAPPRPRNHGGNARARECRWRQGGSWVSAPPSASVALRGCRCGGRCIRRGVTRCVGGAVGAHRLTGCVELGFRNRAVAVRVEIGKARCRAALHGPAGAITAIVAGAAALTTAFAAALATVIAVAAVAFVTHHATFAVAAFMVAAL